MIQRIGTGIEGLDRHILGGLPENTITLVYGPPKVGKSIFCAQFVNQRLAEGWPCLYILSDCDKNMLMKMMTLFNWHIEPYIQEGLLHLIDLYSATSGMLPVESLTLKVASPQNPTDFMVKIIEELKFLCLRTSNLGALLDSATTLFLFNEPALMIRVLKAWGTSVRQAGATGIIVYTEGTTDKKIETMIKAGVDNILYLSRDNKIKVEAMMGCPQSEAQYNITDKGIVV
jgi:KaiC/GvpD/RAD55 family RecA-like ATPase